MGIEALLARLERESVTPVTSPEVGGVTAKPAPALIRTSDTDVTYRASVSDARSLHRWRMQFAHGADLIVTVVPACTLEQIRSLYPTAETATPMLDPPSAPRNCSTCQRLTRFGNCGEPVAAGLADTFRLEKHPGGGSGCVAHAPKLTGVETRVAQLEAVGAIDVDDAALVLKAYSNDPDGWDKLLDTLTPRGLC